jgi:hypothetical protein
MIMAVGGGAVFAIVGVAMVWVILMTISRSW